MIGTQGIEHYKFIAKGTMGTAGFALPEKALRHNGWDCEGVKHETFCTQKAPFASGVAALCLRLAMDFAPPHVRKGFGGFG